MTGRRSHPPGLARLLLGLRPLGSRRAEIASDLEELFAGRLAREGWWRASLGYWVDVLSVWRWNPRGVRVLRDAAQDFTYGLRVFRRDPGAVALSIGGLGLAIGASTAAFTLLSATLLAPAGVASPAAASRVHRAWQSGVSRWWSYGEYVALRELSGAIRLEVIDELNNAAWFSPTAPTIYDNPEHVPLQAVSATFMETFGARPVLGRLLTAADDAADAPAVAIVSERFWKKRLDGDPSVIDRPIYLNGKAVRVVGVVERGFTGLAEPPAVWMTLNGRQALSGDDPLRAKSRTQIAIVARRPDTMSQAQAQAQVSTAAAALGRGGADPYHATGARFMPTDERFTGRNASTLYLIVTTVLVAVALVVLLACLNVANLLRASALARQQEIGVRLALGASRARIVRQLVTESMALGMAAAGIGLILAFWLAPVVARGLNVPVTYDLSPDGRVYALLLVVACAAGIGAGLGPARYGARGDLLSALRAETVVARPGTRPALWRGGLVALQAGASLVLLSVAFLTARAAMQAARIDVGFDPRPLITLTSGYGHLTKAQVPVYLETVLQRLRALPGVRAAALAEPVPFSGGTIGIDLNRDGNRQRALLFHTDAEYFATLGIRVLRGRTYTPAEVRAVAPVVVLSESAARHMWGGADALGRVFRDFATGANVPPATVIGVVSDVVPANLSKLPTAAVYRPIALLPAARILIRTEGAPGERLPPIRAVLRDIDPDIRMDATLVNEGLQLEQRQPLMLASMAGALATLAVILAVIGIYGVASFVTVQRTREIGVRLAMGATHAEVLRLLLAGSARPIVIGLVCGVAAALLAGRMFRGVMFGLTAQDPVSICASAGVLLVTALAAVYVPTRRASRLDPLAVLRQQ
jgi:predicted permease